MRLKYVEYILNSFKCIYFTQVEADRDIYIPGGSLIGWTPETEINPICFDFIKDYDLYFRSVPVLQSGVKDFPVIGEEYKFRVLPYPAIFSIAVEINTSKIMIYTIWLFRYLETKLLNDFFPEG